MGLSDFLLFSGKVFEFVQAQIIYFFCGLTFDFVKRNAISTIEQRKCKGHEKDDRLLISKMEFNVQIRQRNKNVTY